jgi:hypothetical protein
MRKVFTANVSVTASCAWIEGIPPKQTSENFGRGKEGLSQKLLDRIEGFFCLPWSWGLTAPRGRPKLQSALKENFALWTLTSA